MRPPRSKEASKSHVPRQGAATFRLIEPSAANRFPVVVRQARVVDILPLFTFSGTRHSAHLSELPAQVGVDNLVASEPRRTEG